QYRASKSQFFGFLEALLRMCNRPHGARQADFAEIDAIGGKGKAGKRGNKCRRDRQVGGRLADAVAAGDVEINVVLSEPDAAMRLQYSQNHGKPCPVPADDGTA